MLISVMLEFVLELYLRYFVKGKGNDEQVK